MKNGMKKCVNCGREIPASYGFCKYCGAKQPTNNKSTTSQNSSVASNTNNYSYKIITTTSNTSSSNSYNPDEAVNDANKRASLANKRAQRAEKEVNDAQSLKQSQKKEQRALKRAKVAERKTRKMNTKSLKLRRETQKAQRQANDAHYNQQIKEQKLQKQASPKYIKKHRLHLLIWTYLMPIIAFIVFITIGGNISNETTGNLITCTGIGIVSIIAIIMAWSIKNWYKKSSIISVVWNIIWIVVALMALAG